MADTRRVDIETYFSDSIIDFNEFVKPQINKQGNSYSKQTIEDFNIDLEPVTREQINKDDWRPNNLVNKIMEDPQLPINRVPDQLICPLTHKIFLEPVVAADGNTYERIALINHLESHGGVIGEFKDDVTLYQQKPYLYNNRVIQNFIQAEYKEALARRDEENNTPLKEKVSDPAEITPKDVDMVKSSINKPPRPSKPIPSSQAPYPSSPLNGSTLASSTLMSSKAAPPRPAAPAPGSNSAPQAPVNSAPPRPTSAAPTNNMFTSSIRNQQPPASDQGGSSSKKPPSPRGKGSDQ